MRYSVLLFALLAVGASADQTVWSYDLTALPDGWSSSSAWEFDSIGAHIELYAMGKLWYPSCIFTEVLVVPEGADSFTIQVPQYCVGGGSDGAAVYRLYLNLNQEEPLLLWGHNFCNSWSSDTEPIIEGAAISPGDSLSFTFHADVSAVGSMGYAQLYWQMCDLELILHGDIQSLNPISWGSLKSFFRAHIQ